MQLLKLSILLLPLRGEQTKLGAGPVSYTSVGSSETLDRTVGVTSAPVAALEQSICTWHGLPTLDLQALKFWCQQPWDSLLGLPRAAHLPG